MLAYLKHHYFIIHAYPLDHLKLSMTDLNLVEVFKVTVPNIERHLLLKRQDHEEYTRKRKWEFVSEDSYLEYPVPNGDLALRVF